MPSANDNYQDSDYGSDVLTNFDFEIFKFIASQSFIKKTDKMVFITS